MLRSVPVGLLTMLLLLMPVQIAAAATEDNKGTEKLLTIQEAIHAGQKKDADVMDAGKNLSKKKIEWIQTQYAVINEAHKDTGPFARPHHLSKDLEIRMKLPEARKQLKEAGENLIQQERVAANKIRKLYINAVTTKAAEQSAMVDRDHAGKKVSENKLKVKLGMATKSDVEEAESALAEADSALKQARLSSYSAKIELGKAIGYDLQQGYTFELKPEYADLKQDTIWKLIGHAQKNNVALSSAAMTRSLAEEKVKHTQQLYLHKFGPADMKMIDTLYNGKEINYELFAADYEAFLGRVEKQWDGFITFIIPFPKSLFQGEFDGIRYFDDIRYSLPVSMYDMDKARQKEQETLEQLLTGVKTSFLNVKKAEETYSRSLQAQELAEQELSKANTKLKLRQITKEQLSEKEEAVTEAEKQVSHSFISYYSAVHQLDFDTSGAIQPYIKPGILPWKLIDDGLAPLNNPPPSEKPLKGSFAVNSVVEPLTSSLNMEVDPSLNATHYRIYSTDQVAVTDYISVGQPLIHLNLLLQSLHNYIVVFFKDESPVARASFEGIGSTGSLSLEKINSFGEKKGIGSARKPSADLGTVIIGTFRIELPALTKETAAVAMGTLAESGQGMLFQPAGAPGQWTDLQKPAAFEDILGGKSSVVIAKNAIDALKLTVSIGADGSIKSLLTSQELLNELNTLKKSNEQLQEQYDSAVESGQISESAKLLQEIDGTVSKIAFVETLLQGDSAGAAKKLSEWSSALSGTAPVPEGESEAEVLANENELLSESLGQALSAGNAEEIQAVASSLASAMIALSLERQGINQDIEALTEAKVRLNDAYEDALASGENDRLPDLIDALDTIDHQLRIAGKQSSFVQKDALEKVLEQLSLENQTSDELIKLHKEAVQRIIEAEKQKYDEQELQLLNEQSVEIAEQYAGAIQPLPVENVISASFDIKLDLPPVFTEGQAMIQIRPLSESFGALVVWDPMDQSVTISKDGTIVVCIVGEKTAYINGHSFQMETVPRLLLGKTVVPLEFVADSLGIDVKWDMSAKTIQLGKKGDTQ